MATLNMLISAKKRWFGIMFHLKIMLVLVLAMQLFLSIPIDAESTSQCCIRPPSVSGGLRPTIKSLAILASVMTLMWLQTGYLLSPQVNVGLNPYDLFAHTSL